MALILIDNAAELLIHRQCVGYLETDKFYSRLVNAQEAFTQNKTDTNEARISDDLQSSLLTAGQRKGASGKYFVPKLKLLGQNQTSNHLKGDLFRPPTITETSCTT